jgi:hypothetical protein
MSADFERPTCVACFEAVDEADPSAGRIGDFGAYDRAYWRHVSECDAAGHWLRLIARGLAAAPTDLVDMLHVADFDGNTLELAMRYANMSLCSAVRATPRPELPDGVTDLVARRRSVGGK